MTAFWPHSVTPLQQSRIRRNLAGLILATAFSGCGIIGPPVIQHYGAPIYQVGSGFGGDMSPEDAALVRGRITMQELRRNELGEDFNLNRSMDEITYPPE